MKEHVLEEIFGFLVWNESWCNEAKISLGRSNYIAYRFHTSTLYVSIQIQGKRVGIHIWVQSKLIACRKLAKEGVHYQSGELLSTVLIYDKRLATTIGYFMPIWKKPFIIQHPLQRHPIFSWHWKNHYMVTAPADTIGLINYTDTWVWRFQAIYCRYLYFWTQNIQRGIDCYLSWTKLTRRDKSWRQVRRPMLLR